MIKNVKNHFKNSLLLTHIQHNFLIQINYRKNVVLDWNLNSSFDRVVFLINQWKSLTRSGNWSKFWWLFVKKRKMSLEKGLNIRSIVRMALAVCKLKRLSKIYVQNVATSVLSRVFVVLKNIGLKRNIGESTFLMKRTSNW